MASCAAQLVVHVLARRELHLAKHLLQLNTSECRHMLTLCQAPCLLSSSPLSCVFLSGSSLPCFGACPSNSPIQRSAYSSFDAGVGRGGAGFFSCWWMRGLWRRGNKKE
eukprot:1161394-Pelagomonas_calceolata.AAC.5